jgi:hypothetical protein
MSGRAFDEIELCEYRVCLDRYAAAFHIAQPIITIRATQIAKSSAGFADTLRE